MRSIFNACVVSALFLVPVNVFAQDAGVGATVSACPHQARMMGMQKNMGSMMAEVEAMKNDIRDPQMKARMQKIHTQMSDMMANMQKMGGGMMGQGMMGQGMMGQGMMKHGMMGRQMAPAGRPPTAPGDH